MRFRYKEWSAPKVGDSKEERKFAWMPQVCIDPKNPDKKVKVWFEFYKELSTFEEYKFVVDSMPGTHTDFRWILKYRHTI